jgi:hypothetical protein
VRFGASLVAGDQRLEGRLVAGGGVAGQELGVTQPDGRPNVKQLLKCRKVPQCAAGHPISLLALRPPQAGLPVLSPHHSPG